jgi:hypothetical protein
LPVLFQEPLALRSLEFRRSLGDDHLGRVVVGVETPEIVVCRIEQRVELIKNVSISSAGASADTDLIVRIMDRLSVSLSSSVTVRSVGRSAPLDDVFG